MQRLVSIIEVVILFAIVIVMTLFIVYGSVIVVEDGHDMFYDSIGEDVRVNE